MNNDRKYRNEWKYCCMESDLNIINSRLTAILGKDAHSGRNEQYEVHSLYFDDYGDTCVKENDAGISERKKYRIRYYGEDLGFMRLECKSKTGGRCHKESCLLSPGEYRKLVDGKADELFWESDKPLIKSFCLKCMTRCFRPKAIIDYERIAFVEEITHIRITLDRNISASDEVSRFSEGDYIRYPVQEKGWHVLEVKFDYILPGYIKNLITNRHLIQSSFSKYSLGRRTLQCMERRI
ncbi:MAG: polyphosphate polymerase domain-containing protein [Roseburia sp.]|nr:polyphosphate polymerase domain-containing protein [Roseburia sp.]